MKSLGWSRWVLSGAALILACSKDTTNAPGFHSLSGHVKLTGYLVNGSGMFVGNRVVGDADGVRVELLYGAQVVAQTTTVDGVYQFSGLAPGGYRARCRVHGPVVDETTLLTIADGSILVGDTLRLISIGDLLPIPNPLAASGSTLNFAVPDVQHVDLVILDPDGRRIRTLVSGMRPAGINQVLWDGLDEQGVPAPGPLYWVTFESGSDRRAHLLFR